jgi:hypothetical protein
MKSLGGNAPSPLVVAALIAVLIGFIGFMAYRTLGQQETASVPVPTMKVDLSKITPAEQEKILKNFEAARATRGVISEGN